MGRAPSETSTALGKRSDDLARYITVMQVFKDVPLASEEDDAPRSAAAGEQSEQASDDGREARSGSDDAGQHVAERAEKHEHGRTGKTTARRRRGSGSAGATGRPDDVRTKAKRSASQRIGPGAIPTT
ncbi:hypothetical protein E4U53_007850 [Claviceps sorghi]|nr:hypothetical protein E4U53_007850 [Claviceps sorghi]